MKRYLVFAGETYYPDGGWEDFIGDCETTNEAAKLIEDKFCEWAHVIDTETGEKIYSREE